jgi:hypothetical protein
MGLGFELRASYLLGRVWNTFNYQQFSQYSLQLLGLYKHDLYH